MKGFKNLYYQFSSLIPLGLLQKKSGIQVLLPYQHLVSDEEVIHVKHLYPYKNVNQFKSDLEVILKYYKPVSAGEIIQALNTGENLPSNSFLLSFDDGFKETEEIIAPILFAKGVPAVFFINPAFVDNKELFYRCKLSLIIQKVLDNSDNKSLINHCSRLLRGNEESISKIKNKVLEINSSVSDLINEFATLLEISFTDYLKEKKPFLTKSQIQHLIDMGFSVGGHSWDHPYYSQISVNEQIEQTVKSVKFITSEFNSADSLFSFPHSDTGISQTYFNEIIKYGKPIDLYFGTQNQKEELNNRVLHRFNVERSDVSFSKQIKGILLLNILRKMAGKNRVIRGD